MLATQAEITRRHVDMCLMFREVQAENVNVGMMTDIECVLWGSEDFGEVRDEGGGKEGVR